MSDSVNGLIELPTRFWKALWHLLARSMPRCLARGWEEGTNPDCEQCSYFTQ
jgi:hypothetical protein